MRNQNKLTKVIYELLVEREVKSFDVIQATDLLSSNYSNYFSWRKLYLHIYTQSHKLLKQGYLQRIGKPEEMKFQITKKFSKTKFTSYKTLSLLQKENEMTQVTQISACQNDDFFYSEIKEELKLIDYRIFCFKIERDILEKITTTHSTCPAIIKELHNEASNELNINLVKRNTLIKILNTK